MMQLVEDGRHLMVQDDDPTTLPRLLWFQAVMQTAWYDSVHDAFLQGYLTDYGATMVRDRDGMLTVTCGWED